MRQIDWAMLLEYLKLFFSWPPMLAILLFWFVRRFTTEISALIGKIKGIKLPGGSEVTLNEKQQQQEEASPPALDFPGSTETMGTVTGHVNASLAITAEAHGEVPVNKAYSPRISALYPAVNLELILDYMHLNPGPALDDYVDKVFQLHCERTFNIIFGTQVSALVFLDNPTLASPVPAASLVPLYERHRELVGRSDRSLNEFIGFLTGQGLIENVGTTEGPLYQITAAGREFLQHIQRHYPLMWNKKEF